MTTIKKYYNQFYGTGKGLREVWYIPTTPTRENHFRGFCQGKSTFLNSYRDQWRLREEFSLFTTAYLFEGLHDFHKEHGNYKANRRREYKSSDNRTPFNYKDSIILDRLYFDFDMTSSMILKAENVSCDMDDLAVVDANLKELKGNERDILSDATFQDKADYYYRKFNESVYFRQPLEDARKVEKMFESQFGIKGHHVFTGSKGVHSYYLFKPVRIKYATEVIRFIADKIFRQLKIETGDPHVLHDTTKSRVPFSYNPKTNMTVTPFNIDEDYFTIIDNSHKLSKAKGFDTSKSLPSNIPTPMMQESDKLKELLLQGEAYFERMHKENDARQRQFNLLNQRKYNIRHLNQITIETPSDVDKLLEFPCFRRLEWKDRTLQVTFVGFLSFTHLKSAEDVQEANLRFWRQKGVNLQKSRQGLYQTRSVYQKYYLTHNTMKRQGLCQNCQNCFRDKLRMNPLYYERFIEQKAKAMKKE